MGNNGESNKNTSNKQLKGSLYMDLPYSVYFCLDFELSLGCKKARGERERVVEAFLLGTISNACNLQLPCRLQA